MHLLSTDKPSYKGNALFVLVRYDSYICSFGFVMVAIITDNFWHNPKDLVNCPDFNFTKYDTQPERREDSELIDTQSGNVFITKTTDYWLTQRQSQRISCAPVNDLDKALNDEQVLHRNLVLELKHLSGKSAKRPGNPLKLSRSNDDNFLPVPPLGTTY